MTLASRGQEWAGPGFAEAYAASYATLNVGAVPTVLEDVATGARTLLDVGSGPGLFAAAAAEHGLRVTICEPDPAMLILARERIGSAIRTLTSRLPALELPDAMYDRVVANFVIDHVEDPQAAVVELDRVCLRGGLVAVTGWLDESDAQQELISKVYADSGVAAPPVDHTFARTLDGWRSLVSGTGLNVEKAEVLEWDWRISPELLWAGIAAGAGPLGMTYVGESPEVRATLERVFAEVAEAYRDGDDLVLRSRAAYVLARKA